MVYEGSEEEGRPVPMQGWPPMARSAARGRQLRPRPPAKGRPTTAKAPCRGSCQHVRLPAGMIGACEHRQRPQPGRKGQPPVARSQGVTARCEAARGNPTARAAACMGGRSCKGNARARRHCPPTRCCRGQQRLPQGRLPTSTACSTVACAGQWWHSDGKGRILLRKG
ncbi:hypothetical protein BHM03_00059858 [Ensete ventricosum]|nr:hypothetical protein BHM03_00059858 [Ensete ventricosum]